MVMQSRQRRFEAVRMNQSTILGNERRGRQRFNINAPLTLFVGDRQIAAYTRNLSNRGVYFFLAQADSRLINRDFEFMVELPPEITLSTWCKIRCQGRVVRTEKSTENMTGVAAEILDFSIFREPGAGA